LNNYRPTPKNDNFDSIDISIEYIKEKVSKKCLWNHSSCYVYGRENNKYIRKGDKLSY